MSNLRSPGLPSKAGAVANGLGEPLPLQGTARNLKARSVDPVHAPTMPIFEYICRDCGEQFELLIRGSSEPTCPHCESTELEKMLSLPKIRSSGTHDLAMRAAKKRDQRRAYERVNDQIAYERDHDD